MSPANAARRTAIGFQGGQVLSLRLSEEQLTSLRDDACAKAASAGWRSRPPTAPC